MKYILFLLSLIVHVSMGQTATGSPNDVGVDAKTLATETDFIEGMKAYLKEDYNNSTLAFKKLTLKIEDNAAAHFMMAQSYHKLNQEILATESAKKALNIDKNNADYLDFYGDVAQKTNQLDEAEWALKKYLKLKPFERDGYYKLFAVYGSKNETKEQLNILNDIEKKFGTNENLVKLKQSLLLESNKVDKAVNEGAKYANVDPGFVIQQSKVLHESGKSLEAINLLEKSIEAFTDNGPTYELLSEYLIQRNDFEKARVLTLKVIDQKGLLNENKIKVFGNYFAAQKKDPNPELLSMVDKLVAVAPNEARPWVFKGDILNNRGAFLDARNSYLKALEKNKAVFEIWQAVIELDVKLNNYSNIVKDSENAIEYFPSQSFLWYHSGFGLKNLLKYDDALAAFEEAKNLTVQNKSLVAHIDTEMAEIYMLQGKYTLADKTLQKLITGSNEKALYLYSRCAIKLNQNLDKANAIVDELLKTKPKDLGYLELKGDIFYKLNNIEQAKEYWRKAQISDFEAQLNKLK